MSEMYAHVSVRILEKEYQVSCPADERTALLDSAEVLNAKMKDIRDSGKVVGLERIAVMAALNMANDLLQANAKDKVLEDTLGNRPRKTNSEPLFAYRARTAPQAPSCPQLPCSMALSRPIIASTRARTCSFFCNNVARSVVNVS